MEIKKQVYTRKYNNDTYKYETIGGQSIEMQFTVFETFTICKMRIFDENNNIILTVDLNTTPDQVITCLPTRLATTISKIFYNFLSSIIIIKKLKINPTIITLFKN